MCTAFGYDWAECGMEHLPLYGSKPLQVLNSSSCTRVNNLKLKYKVCPCRKKHKLIKIKQKMRGLYIQYDSNSMFQVVPLCGQSWDTHRNGTTAVTLHTTSSMLKNLLHKLSESCHKMLKLKNCNPKHIHI